MSVEILIIILILLFSITFHEYAHGWIAYKLGDPTPKSSGRLTLNPLAHIDPLGTIIIPLLIVLISWGRIPPIGYAKPVPINPYNFKNPKKDILWVALAGPLSNFLLALLLSLILRLEIIPVIKEAIVYGIVINLALCVFNLIPIPPLDGSRAVASFLSYKNAHLYLKMEKFGFLIIIFLFWTRILQHFIIPVINFLIQIIGVKGIVM